MLLRTARASLLALLLICVCVAAAQAAPVRGPDYSNNNGCGVNLRAVHAAGAQFVGFKATEGLGFEDRCFPHYWGEAQHEGFIRLAYDFAHLGVDPRADARHFVHYVNQAGGLTRTIAVIDVEAYSGGSSAHNRAWVQAWVNEVFATGHPAKILVYTAPFFWNPHLGCWRPAGAGLWVATYGPRPSLPCGFAGWDFWQSSDGVYGPAPHGFAGLRSDVSIFSGNHPALVGYTVQVAQHAYASRTLKRGAKGTDVRGLQKAATQRMHARHRHGIHPDGVYGTQTIKGVHFVKYALGFPLAEVKKGSCSGRCQLFIAHPDKRPKTYPARANARSHR